MKNVLGRELPEYIEGYGKVKPFQGAFASSEEITKTSVQIKAKNPGEEKVLSSIEKAIKKAELKDGMTISFHHHLRNGDYVLNMVLEEIAKAGIKDLTVAASSIFPSQAPLVDHMKNGVVTGIYANYISGPVA